MDVSSPPRKETFFNALLGLDGSRLSVPPGSHHPHIFDPSPPLPSHLGFWFSHHPCVAHTHTPPPPASIIQPRPKVPTDAHHVRHVTTRVCLRGSTNPAACEALLQPQHQQRLQQLRQPRRGLDQDFGPCRAQEDTEPHCSAQLPYVASPAHLESQSVGWTGC